MHWIEAINKKAENVKVQLQDKELVLVIDTQENLLLEEGLLTQKADSLKKCSIFVLYYVGKRESRWKKCNGTKKNIQSRNIILTVN